MPRAARSGCCFHLGSCLGTAGLRDGLSLSLKLGGQGFSWLNHRKLCACSEIQDIFRLFSTQTENTCSVIIWLHFFPPLLVAGSPGKIFICSLRRFKCGCLPFWQTTVPVISTQSLWAVDLRGSISLREKIAFVWRFFICNLSRTKKAAHEAGWGRRCSLAGLSSAPFWGSAKSWGYTPCTRSQGHSEDDGLGPTSI